jgi:CheY-like chemotaxis protein
LSEDTADLTMVSALIAGLAHDFNNLLMVMGSCAHFLEAAPELGEAARGDAALLAEAVKRAAALSERLSAFGRRAALRVDAVDVGAIAAEAEKTLRRLAGEDIAVQVDARRGLVVRADAVRIEQLLLCATLGARRLLPRGGTLAVAVTEGQQSAILSVSFTPRAGEPPAAGPVPGLAVMRAIAAEAGGALAEQGAGVQVTLPLQASAPGPARVPTGGSETVLVVEDDTSTRRIIGRVLGSAGYRVVEAADFADALRVADAGEPIAVVLADVVLPDGSALEVIAGLRARQPDVRVILTSGYPDSVLEAYGLPAGSRLLAKPFTSAQLLDAIRAALD